MVVPIASKTFCHCPSRPVLAERTEFLQMKVAGVHRSISNYLDHIINHMPALRPQSEPLIL